VIRSSVNAENDFDMTEHELQKLSDYKRKYYKKCWPKMLLKLIPFKKPCVANSDSLTSLMDNDEERHDQENWFYCSFVKPGRHDYIVRKSWINPDRDPDLDEKGITMPTILGKLNLKNLS